MFNFEKLDVWQEAIQFADLVYELTSNFPDEERFGLTNQMRRAAVSVSSNIAEGSSRISRTDFARFVEIATGSLFEVVSQTTIALRRHMSRETIMIVCTRRLKNKAGCSADCADHCLSRNAQLSTKDPQAALSWRAAEGAGERRCDVGCGYNLPGRFFYRHFFAGRR